MNGCGDSGGGMRISMTTGRRVTTAAVAAAGGVLQRKRPME